MSFGVGRLLLRKTGMLVLEAFKVYLLSAVKIAAKERNSGLVTLGGKMLQLQIVYTVDHSIFTVKMDSDIKSCFNPLQGK